MKAFKVVVYDNEKHLEPMFNYKALDEWEREVIDFQDPITEDRVIPLTEDSHAVEVGEKFTVRELYDRWMEAFGCQIGPDPEMY